MSSQVNAKLHLTASVIAIGLGYYFEIDRDEWILLTIAIAMVFAAELFNTAIEKLGDAIDLDYNPQIKNAKDLAAGGVLMTALGAAVIGILIFGPRLLQCIA